MTTTTEILTAEIVAIQGCACPDSVRWFNCPCSATEKYYNALPINWRDVLSDGDEPDDMPAIEAVADIIKANPGCKFRYLGGNCRILGGGHDGVHIELAREMAKGS